MIQPGSKLAHYEIVSALGKGGMGEVWRARDQKLGREVAIKTLPEEFAKDEERLARFEREAKLLASLNHPNIAAIYGFEEDNSTRFLVLELVEGDTLAERLKQGAIPVEESLKLALQIAEALEAAHEKGVIHRDLKPANIKVTPEGKIKVLDFGLAKAFAGEGSDANLSQSPTLSMAATQQGVILGTAAYMSPEQARGETVDRRADIWAFGAVLFEMLTGSETFGGRTVSDVLASILKTDPDWTRLPANLHPRIQLLLARCLDKDSRDRYRHIADARVDLQAVLRNPEGSLMQPAKPHVPPVPRQTWLWLLGSVVITAVVVGVVVMQVSAPLAPSSVSNPTPLTANPIEASVTSMAISPDGTYLAYADLTGLYLRTLTTGEIHSVDVPEGFRTWGVRWFPGGTNLLLTAFNEGTDVPSLYSLSILGGTPRKLVDGATKAVVAPDGSAIAFLLADSSAERAEIWLMGPNGEQVRRFLVADQGESYWQLDFSPDSQRLAFGSWDTGPDGSRLLQIQTISLGDAESTILVSDARLFQNWIGVLPFVWGNEGQLVYARRELAPNQQTSNLWSVQTDIQRGTAVTDPVQITKLSGFNVRGVSASRDGGLLTFLLVRNQADVYVADLGEDGTKIQSETRLTTDQREDLPSGWTADGTAILFETLRAGTWDVYKRDLDQASDGPLFSGPRSQRNPIATYDGFSILFQESTDPEDDVQVRTIMRGPTESGPVEAIADTVGSQVRCSDARAARCVSGERIGNEYVFSQLDPAGGKGTELVRIDDFPPFTEWDMTRDGTRVAVVHNDDNRVRLVGLADGEESPIELDEWRGFEYVSWAADGRSLYINGSSAASPGYPALLHVDLNGQVSVVRVAPNEWHVRPVASPDGIRLAFAVMPFHGNVWSIQIQQ